MKRPRSTPEYHAGASAFSGTCDTQTLCIECRETYPPYAAHRCKPECTQCAARIIGRQYARDGYLFCSSAHRATWSAIERDRVGVPL